MTAIALLGSGEFETWAGPVDSWCVARSTSGSKRVLVLPTASAPEGDDVFARWADMGVEHYRALGLDPEVLDLRERADASRDDLIAAIAGARLAFFSGGNPGYLAETLAGTPFWAALAEAVAAGSIAIGGCSAGAAFLGSMAPYTNGDSLDHWSDGTRLLARAYVMPHFDMLDSYVPGLRAMLLGMKPDDAVAVGIDEYTALYGDGDDWAVAGAGSVWVGDGTELVPHREGETLHLPLR